MSRSRQMWAKLMLAASLATTSVVTGVSPAYASDASFLLPADQHYLSRCGRFWPSTGYFQTTHVSGDNYVATLNFRMTQSQITALLCVSGYLELDFRIFGFSTPSEWDGYTVATNIPGAIHDVATMDYTVNQATPGVTRIRVADLHPNVEYSTSVIFDQPLNPSSGSPRVSVEWVPSYWASSAAEISFCALWRPSMGDAECIFGKTRAFLSHGYNNNASLIFGGYRWWEFSSTTPTSSTPPTTDVAPSSPTGIYPPAQMFIRGDSAVFARTGIGTNWTQETDAGNATKIAASSTGVQMFVRGDSSIWAKKGVGYGGWIQEAGPGNASAIAVGGDTQLFLRGDNAVFATSCIGCAWVQETAPGTATAIAVSSTGMQMIITSDAAVWTKTGIGYGGWTQEVGPGNAVAIAVGGNTRMFIRGDAAVFAKSGVIADGGWIQETSPGNANKIAVSDTGVQMFIRGDAAVFARSGIGSSWAQAVGPGNAWAIAVGGNTELFARGDNALFATGCIGCAWTQETGPGNIQAIATG